MRRLFALYRSDELRFEDLEHLVGDDEHSVLFRLKGRCHALFRQEPGRRAVAMRREALFDLAVGSLFHEAMKFRENFYQREVYGPRVRALRTESGAENEALFREFEKILSAVAQRLDEGLHESEALLVQTREQLALLLVEYSRQRLRHALPDREPGRRGGRLRGGSRRPAGRRSTATPRRVIASRAARISPAATSPRPRRRSTQRAAGGC